MQAWQILQLDPQTATEKEVKVAYARLLKRHRPDQDVEGFQRVHQAYLEALDWLKVRPEKAEKDTFNDFRVNESDARLHDDISLQEPEDWLSAAEALRKVIEEGNGSRIQGALSAFCGGRVVKEQALEKALRFAFGGDISLLAGHANPEMFLALSNVGHLSLMRELISVWNFEGKIVPLGVFADFLLDAAPALSYPQGAELMVETAILIAYWRENVATELVGLAFPFLVTDVRPELIYRLEQEMTMGRLFLDFPPDLRRFWWDRRRGHGGGWDWDNDFSQEAVDHVIDTHDSNWAGVSLIRHLVPANVWERSEKRFGHRVKAGAKIFLASPFPPDSPYSSPFVRVFSLIFMAGFIFVSFWMVVNYFLEPRSTTSYPAPPIEEIHCQVDEILMKKHKRENSAEKPQSSPDAK